MDGLLLHCLNLQSIQLLIKHLGKGKDELCSSNLAKESTLSRELKEGPRKIPFSPLLCQIAEDRLALLKSPGQSLLVRKEDTCISQKQSKLT